MMRVFIRTCGVLAMFAGGVTLVAALLSVALSEEPFPMALILAAGGFVLFMVGAVLHDKRPDHSYQDTGLPT